MVGVLGRLAQRGRDKGQLHVHEGDVPIFAAPGGEKVEGGFGMGERGRGLPGAGERMGKGDVGAGVVVGGADFGPVVGGGISGRDHGGRFPRCAVGDGG